MGLSGTELEFTRSPKAVISAWAGNNQKIEANPVSAKVLIRFEEIGIIVRDTDVFLNFDQMCGPTIFDGSVVSLLILPVCRDSPL